MRLIGGRAGRVSSFEFRVSCSVEEQKAKSEKQKRAEVRGRCAWEPKSVKDGFELRVASKAIGRIKNTVIPCMSLSEEDRESTQSVSNR